MQKYPHITESYACILKISATTVDLSIFELLRNMFYTQTLKISNIIIQ